VWHPESRTGSLFKLDGWFMKKIVITENSIEKMNNCFCNKDESLQFYSDLDEMSRVINKISEVIPIVSHREAISMVIKQTFAFVGFCRDHIELIHRMIVAYDCQEMTEEEYNEMMEEDV
jgi:hypothetical protein